MSADDALHESAFHNRRPGWFRTSSSKCFKERPQGRCFLVEMATNHRLQNRSSLTVARVNVTDERKPYHPQEQAVVCQPVIMVWRTYIKMERFSFTALWPGSDPVASRCSLQALCSDLKCVYLFTRSGLCQKVLGTNLASESCLVSGGRVDERTLSLISDL